MAVELEMVGDLIERQAERSRALAKRAPAVSAWCVRPRPWTNSAARHLGECGGLIAVREVRLHAPCHLGRNGILQFAGRTPPEQQQFRTGGIGLQKISHALIGIGRVVLRQMQISDLHHGFGVAGSPQGANSGMAWHRADARRHTGVGRPPMGCGTAGRARFLEAAHAFVGTLHVAQEHHVIVELFRSPGKTASLSSQVGGKSRACRGRPDPGVWVAAFRVFPSRPADYPAAGTPRQVRLAARPRPVISPTRITRRHAGAQQEERASAAIACRRLMRAPSRPAAPWYGRARGRPAGRRRVDVHLGSVAPWPSPILSSWSRKRQIASSPERRKRAPGNGLKESD